MKKVLPISYLIILLVTMTMLLSGQQLTRENIKEVLVLQEEKDIDAVAENLYRRWVEINSWQTDDLLTGIGLSSLSGLALGAHESYTFGYQHTGWLPGFMQHWYGWRVNTDAVFVKSFTWQKTFREVDYITDRMAFGKLKKFFKQKWYFAYAVHWVVKNTFATLIRDKFKHDRFFYSFQLDLIIPGF